MVGDIRRRKLESLIQKRVATLLTQELSDPRAPFITVTEIKLDREIKYCTVHYSVLGAERERNLGDHMLRHARGHIRSAIAKILTTRTVPEVVFEYDDRAEKTRGLERLIDEVAQDTRRLEEKLEPDPEDGSEPEPDAEG